MINYNSLCSCQSDEKADKRLFHCAEILLHIYIIYSIFHTDIQTEYDYSYMWTVVCKKVVAYSEYSEGACVCMHVWIRRNKLINMGSVVYLFVLPRECQIKILKFVFMFR